MEIIVFDKDKKGILSPKLTLSEYKCKCRSKLCTRTFVNPRTVRAFQLTRNIYGCPIAVTSAFRCQTHNKKVGGLANSMHLTGSAIDLRPAIKDFHESELDRLEKVAILYFDVVIRYNDKGFIHCHMLDDDSDLDRYLTVEQ